jgi:hypothetical protein
VVLRAVVGRLSSALAFLLAASTAAEVGTAGIELRIVGAPSGADVAVTLASAEEARPAWTARARHAAAFTGVFPGRYRLSARAARRAPAEIALRVAPGETVALRVDLEKATVVVVDRYRGTVGTEFVEEELRGLPSGRTAWSLLETADATAILDRIEGAGLAAGEPGLVGIHGSSWTQAAYRMGLLDLTDPDRRGHSLLYPDLAPLAAIDIPSGLLPADVGGPGPVVELLARPPSAIWRGSAEFGWLTEALQAGPSGGAPPVARFGHWRGGGFSAGGPLVKERWALSLAGSLVRSRRFEGEEPWPLSGDLLSLATEVTFFPSPRDEARLFTSVQELRRPSPGRARYSPSDLTEDDRFFGALLRWEHRSDGGSRGSISAGYHRGTFEPGAAGGRAERVVERLRDGPVAGLFPGRGRSDRWQLAASFSAPARKITGGPHFARVGVEVSRSTSLTRRPEPRGLTAETVNGLPARVWDYGWAGPESVWRATDLSTWAADRMSYGRLSLEIGGRYDLTLAAPAGDSATITWSALSPRVAARVRITTGGTLAGFAGYARYRHRLPLPLLAFGDPTGPQGLVHRWNDADGDRVLDAGEVGALIARVGPGSSVASIDPGLEPPRTEEVVAGLDARLGRDWTVRFLGLRRRERDLLASVNLGVPPSAYAERLVPDPGGDLLGAADEQLLPIFDRKPESFGQDRYLLTNPDGENALHEGLELRMTGQVGPRLRLRLGATASRSIGPGGNRGFRARENDQGLTGEIREDPNASTFTRGRLFFDRAYTIKIAAFWHAPGDLRLGAEARYQDGQPFARFVIAPDLAQGPEAVMAIPRGRSRFSYTLTVDARLEKGFPLGRRRRFALAAEAFNLLDQRKGVEEDAVTGPSLRNITLVQPPRAVRLGARVEF